MLTKSKKDLLKHLSKPLFHQGSINVNINRYFTNVDGTIIDKSATLAVMRKNYPVFLLGNFDRVGAYNISQKTIQMPSGVFFLCTYVHGYNEPFLWNSPLNDVQTRFRKGDIITVFTDSLDAPTNFCFIQQTLELGAMASFISNTQTEQKDGRLGVIEVKNVSLQVDNESQLNSPWTIVFFDNIGNFDSDPFNPGSIYRSPYYKLNDFIELNIAFTLSQYMALNFLFLFASDTINVNFRINN
jgi:hypothetical protein